MLLVVRNQDQPTYLPIFQVPVYTFGILFSQLLFYVESGVLLRISRCVFVLIMLLHSAMGETLVLRGEELRDGGVMMPELPEVTASSLEQPEQLSMEQLLARLEETESRISAMQTEQELLAKEIAAASSASEPEEEKEPTWYEKYGFRGYTQFRINDVVDIEPGSAPPQHVGDGSIGENQNFSIRRARFILFGDVTDRIYLYFQPDFAVTPPGSPDSIFFGQIRDLYADLYLDDDRVYRFRVGQSKVPYGWENLQSSQNRLPLDRNDGLNSAVRNERDLGVFFYWTPEPAQALFKSLVDDNLKGSGNYGVFGMGFYNGQGGSFREQNDDLHFMTRLTLPYTFESGQVIESSFQAYTGKYTVLSSPISPTGIGPPVRPGGTLEIGNVEGLRDERLAATFVYYPQPWGFQTEWNVGRGPALNDAQTEVVDRPLYGGYAMTMYRIKTRCYGEFWPYARWSYYKGGYKSERNAPFSLIDETELGLEWQISKSLEFSSMYTITDRTNTQALGTANTLSYGQFDGSILRFQLQVNY